MSLTTIRQRLALKAKTCINCGLLMPKRIVCWFCQDPVCPAHSVVVKYRWNHRPHMLEWLKTTLQGHVYPRFRRGTYYRRACHRCAARHVALLITSKVPAHAPSPSP